MQWQRPINYVSAQPTRGAPGVCADLFHCHVPGPGAADSLLLQQLQECLCRLLFIRPRGDAHLIPAHSTNCWIVHKYEQVLIINNG